MSVFFVSYELRVLCNASTSVPEIFRNHKEICLKMISNFKTGAVTYEPSKANVATDL